MSGTNVDGRPIRCDTSTKKSGGQGGFGDRGGRGGRGGGRGGGSFGGQSHSKNEVFDF